MVVRAAARIHRRTTPAPQSGKAFDGVKVFSATKGRDREVVGEVVTAWIAGRDDIEVGDIVVRQSSDASYHCISIVVFYRLR